MSDLFGNHIVGFPTRWLKSKVHVLIIIKYFVKTYISSENLKIAYMITYFSTSGYQLGRADDRKSCILNGERLSCLQVLSNGICDVK